ncbi:helix-turn-helix transcriptional regulator [Aureibacillus halotolerans]|uniref:YesN/AraC family two-component response regulator n=1 Tax=Aureibacillus halotolerans TaxID=1508390 RepID=A0A4R6U842_9BACI|nr:helix-turn-helix domain-containing protein [Aureibacillus halotolerans]TDQ42730.1 YesN/AraC family two-component response regulator [Aureibacillus halotolerans]
MKIWIIEPDEHIQVGMKWLIQGSHLNVSTVEASRTVEVSKIKAFMPTILIATIDDMSNEDEKNFEALITTLSIPWIAMVSKLDIRFIRKAFLFHARDVLLKPIDTADLLSTLEIMTTVEIAQPLVIKGRDYLANQPAKRPRSMAVCATPNPSEIEGFLAYLHRYTFTHKNFITPNFTDVMIGFYDASLHECIQEMSAVMRGWYEQTDQLVIIAATNDLGKSVVQMYQECKEGLHRSFFHGFNEVHVRQDEVSQTKPATVSNEEMSEWKKLILQGNAEKISKFIRRRYKPWGSSYDSPFVVRIRISQLVAFARFQEGLEDAETEAKAKYEAMLQAIWNAHTLEEMIECIQAWMLVLRSKVGDTLEQAILYLESHYMNQDLKLQDVAYSIQRNPSYVSQLIAKKLNSNFRQVLNEIRIEKAKEKILGSDDSMKKIALQTGFSSPGYFAKLFREHVGISPSDYRSDQRRHVMRPTFVQKQP